MTAPFDVRHRTTIEPAIGPVRRVGPEPTDQAMMYYGMAVMASEFPSMTVFEEAIETAVGSGSFGSFAIVGRVASEPRYWTLWAGYAPRDGKKRRLRARHEKDGCTPSAYTPSLDVIPWTTVQLAPYVSPQGTVSISSTGRARFSLDGGYEHASYRYDKSTSSYPADATVASSGTTLNGRLQNDVDTGTDLTLGQRIYITIIPFTGPSATGVQGPSIHLTATRHDFTASKTVYFAPMGFTPNSFSVDFYEIVNGYIKPYNVGTVTFPGFVTQFVDNFQLPKDCVITDVAFELYSGTAGTGNGECAAALYRVDTTGGETSLATVTHATGAGWATKTASLSETASANRRYKVELTLTVVDTGFETDCRCSGYYVTYTMPSELNTL